MPLIFVLAGVLVLGVPIAFTFLRLADKIGPENSTDACWIGFLLWIVCLSIFDKFISDAMQLLGH